METEYIVLISVLCGVVCLLVSLTLVFKSAQHKLEKYILNTFNKEEIIGATTKANFFGIKSKGARQIRGNGAIVLTKDQLFFVRALPFAEYTIPIDKITGVSLPKSFRGKTVFKELLCVHYKRDGQEDAIAWALKSPDKWKLSIDSTMNNR